MASHHDMECEPLLQGDVTNDTDGRGYGNPLVDDATDPDFLSADLLPDIQPYPSNISNGRPLWDISLNAQAGLKYDEDTIQIGTSSGDTNDGSEHRNRPPYSDMCSIDMIKLQNLCR